MLKLKHLRSVILPNLMIFLVFTTVVKAEISEKPAGDDLLRILPAESLFCVRVNNLENSISQLDQFLTGISPMPMFLSMTVRGQLAKLLGSQELTGLNMRGSFALFGMTTNGEPTGPKQPDIFIGLLVPVTDYKQFIDGDPNLSPPDANGISKKTGRPLIKQVGNYALLGLDNNDNFAATAKSISDGKTSGLAGILDTNEAGRAMKEPFWAYGNVQLTSKIYGEKIRTELEDMKTEMSNAALKNRTRIDVNDLIACYQADVDGDKRLTTDEIDQQITKLKTEMDCKEQNIQAQIKQLEQQENQPADSDSNMSDTVKEQIEKLKIIDDSKREMQARIDRLENIKNRLANMEPGQKVEIKELVRQVEDVNEQSNNPQAAKLAANVMNMYAAVLETLMKETKFLSLTVRPEPNVCNTALSISALPGTDMANIFVADTSAGLENKFLAYLEDGAVMNFAGKMNAPVWKLYAKSIDLISPMMAMSPEDTAKIKALLENAAVALGDSMAGSFAVDTKNKPSFKCNYVIAVKDKEKFNQLIEEGAQMMNASAITDFYKSCGFEMGFTIKRSVDNYKDIPIDSAKFMMKSTEPNSPQGQMINAMYGEGFDYRWAIVDGLCVCAMGGDVESAIRQLIDQAKAGGPGQLANETRAALSLIPQAGKADFFGMYNFLRWFKIIGTMMPVPVPQMDTPTSGNIAFAGKITNGKMAFEAAFPKQHLMEMMGMFRMTQQQQMQPKQQSNNP